ncbi:kinase-like protein [Neolentinus lepideus HHB14362 ss-1]|uniref:Kinase-like protein n=1 Tax=Neolentinus lepideus HHB14362 ss-1 TaxID=1314782 RepID=A0A165NS10_9AGAM|nr:kinase-like protein [Neolentinus lepideus HHB14362 ss-1]
MGNVMSRSCLPECSLCIPKRRRTGPSKEVEGETEPDEGVLDTAKIQGERDQDNTSPGTTSLVDKERRAPSSARTPANISSYLSSMASKEDDHRKEESLCNVGGTAGDNCSTSGFFYDPSDTLRLISSDIEIQPILRAPYKASILMDTIYKYLIEGKLGDLDAKILTTLSELSRIAGRLPSGMYIEPLVIDGLDRSVETGYSDIYKVVREGIPVAVKQGRFAIQEGEKHREERDARGMREALFLGCLRDCAFIVPFIGVFDTRPVDHWSLLNIVTSWQNNGSVSNWTKTKPRTLDEIRGMIVKIAMAMRDLHARGIAHNDIATRNVLLGVDGRIMLCDLGLASIISPGEPTPSITVNPVEDEEVELAKCFEGPQLDVIMFGALCYELLTGIYLDQRHLALIYGGGSLKHLEAIDKANDLRDIIGRCWTTSVLTSMADIVALLTPGN